jgi:hypothetical protein
VRPAAALGRAVSPCGPRGRCGRGGFRARAWACTGQNVAWPVPAATPITIAVAAGCHRLSACVMVGSRVELPATLRKSVQLGTRPGGRNVAAVLTPPWKTQGGDRTCRFRPETGKVRRANLSARPPLRGEAAALGGVSIDRAGARGRGNARYNMQRTRLVGCASRAGSLAPSAEGASNRGSLSDIPTLPGAGRPKEAGGGWGGVEGRW